MRLPAGKIVLLTAVLFALSIAAVFIWFSCEQPRKFDAPPEKRTLGIYRYTTSGLILIAEDQGFFAQQGLDVTNKHYEYGVLAVRGVLAGNINIAAAADSVVAWNILRGEDLEILAAIDSAVLVRLVARADRGIRQWSDLKSKKSGLTAGTVTDFLLDRALTFNKLSRDDIELVHLEPLKSADALNNNDVDAVVVWSPLDERAREELGGNVVSWSVQYGQDYYWVLVCKNELPRKRPQAAERLLAALVLSEKLLASDQAECRQIVSRRRADHQRSVDKAWPYHNLRVSLCQKMVLAMEDAARWLSLKGSSKGKTSNSLNFIYFDGLETVKPVAVSVIH